MERDIFEKCLKLREEGKTEKEILALFPAEKEMIAEQFDLIRWIESERSSIAVPKQALEKILAKIEIAAPAPVAVSTPVLRSPVLARAGMPVRSSFPAGKLSEILPKRNGIVDTMKKPVQSLSGSAPVSVSPILAEETEEEAETKRGWARFSEMVMGRKVWFPAGAIATLLLIIGLNHGTPAPSGELALNTEQVSVSPQASTTPAPKTAARTATFAAPTANQPIRNVDDAVTALSAGSEKEKDIITGSDSGVAESNAQSIDKLGSTYDENSI